ncbi:MAG: HPr family phosphocarrier protein, partial [Alphaproteobacteria bacterium]|nr:HPr family phosphocarrier protein [Alphaproteobacteria bacterium]
IMGLMMLAASKGTTIKVTCSGKEGEKVMCAIEELLNNKFGEE